MALVLQDRVKENSTTSGTGTLTLAGAYTGFRTFASCLSNSDTTYYCIHNLAPGYQDEWEVGLGTYSSNTLSRDTVLSSSAGGTTKVPFTAGPGGLEVFITYPATKSVYENASGDVVQNQFTDLNVTGTATINVATLTAGTISTTPNVATDIANKQYVDTLVSSGITYHTSVRVESPTALTADYNNGTDGVGATLTNAGTNAAIQIDGVSLNVTDRVLVYTQANATHNGVYVVSTQGAPDSPGPGAKWVLTRAADADTYGLKDPDALGEGDAFFVRQGNTGAGETYVCNTQGTITFGTTDITFTQISSAQIYSAGTGLTLDNTTFSITNTNVSAATYGSASEVAQITFNAQGQATSASNVAIAITAANVSGLAPSATTDTTNASNITSGTLLNAYTTASSSNGASTIVARDSGGNFSANTITANLTGNASGTAGSLATAQNISISGGATAANVSFNGTAGVDLNVTAINASVINTGTIGNNYTTGSSSNGANTLVLRDATGSFTANNVTATNIIASGDFITSLNASVINTGTLNNARTTGSSSNGANTLVLRDATGSFAGNVITASDFSGSGANVTSLNASALSSGTVGTARLASGTANSSTYLRGDQTWASVPSPNNGTLSLATSGTGLSGSATFTADSSSNVTFTVTSNASSSNGASTIVARDASGNFSANTITATLTGTASALVTGNSYQVGSLGVGTAASGTTGEIRATNNITAYFSDDRLKTKLGGIPDALAKLKSLEGFYYEPNPTAQALGYEVKKEVGVSAQQVQAVMPEVVAPAPIDEKYLTVRYERLVPLLIEAIKELEAQVAELKRGK